jgi:hypothetical protein
MQLMVLILSPIPGFDMTFNVGKSWENGEYKTSQVQFLSDYLGVFMVLRIFFPIKVVFNYHKYRDAFSKTIIHEHKFYPTNWFLFKVNND